MPLLVTSEHNKDCYDLNVPYTSFGRNKSSRPQPGAGRRRGEGAAMGAGENGLHGETDSKMKMEKN